MSLLVIFFFRTRNTFFPLFPFLSTFTTAEEISLLCVLPEVPIVHAMEGADCHPLNGSFSICQGSLPHPVSHEKPLWNATWIISLCMRAQGRFSGWFHSLCFWPSTNIYYSLKNIYWVLPHIQVQVPVIERWGMVFKELEDQRAILVSNRQLSVYAVSLQHKGGRHTARLCSRGW